MRTIHKGGAALRITLTALFALAWVAQAEAQGDDARSPTEITNPSGGGEFFNSVQTAASSNVFVSVREASGLPVMHTAVVKLVCPLSNVNLSRPAADDGPMAHFFTVPAGDCRIEVSASGYKVAKESVEVLQSVTHRNQMVFVYLHPESEVASAGRPAMVPAMH